MRIAVAAWSGNVRPWRADLWDDDDRWVARTGFCATRERAMEAGRSLAARIEAAHEDASAEGGAR